MASTRGTRPALPDEEQREHVLELLSHYRRARERAQADGLVVSIDVRDPVLRLRDGHRRLHGLRPLVVWALDDHIARRLAALRRQLRGQAVETGEPDVQLLERCDHLEASLKPVPYRRLLALLLVTVPAVALGVMHLLFEGDAGAHDKGVGGSLTEAGELVSDLAQRLLTLAITDVPEVLQAMGALELRTMVFVVLLELLALYGTVRPLVSSFRVKRALLCGSEDRDFRTAATGAYRLESRLLGPAEREVPLDLIVLALPMLLPLYIGGFVFADMLADGFGAAEFTAAVLIAAPATARLAYLLSLARRRARNARGLDEPAPAAATKAVPRSLPSSTRSAAR